MKIKNKYADKVKAIKDKLSKELKEKEDQKNLIQEVWGLYSYS